MSSTDEQTTVKDNGLEILIKEIYAKGKIVALDAAKCIPGAKYLIDRENYTTEEKVTDVFEIILLASITSLHGPRNGIDQILLGISLTSRFYKEISKDLHEEFKIWYKHIETRLEHNQMFNNIKNYLIAADRVVRDGYSIPLLLAGWALADILLISNINYEKDNHLFLNLSSFQHFLVPYGISNILLRTREEAHHAQNDEYIPRLRFNPIFHLTLMTLAVGGWELYEKIALNFDITQDTYGDIIAGTLGWTVPMTMPHIKIITKGKGYLSHWKKEAEKMYVSFLNKF
ncbi:MAG: hypothetical protein NDI94_00475 [Candidatus Woesearchaeota archaeon]|nr:hypothetical protein [Candidatus Woesearchaeota archaeon]